MNIIVKPLASSLSSESKMEYFRLWRSLNPEIKNVGISISSRLKNKLKKF